LFLTKLFCCGPRVRGRCRTVDPQARDRAGTRTAIPPLPVSDTPPSPFAKANLISGSVAWHARWPRRCSSPTCRAGSAGIEAPSVFRSRGKRTTCTNKPGFVSACLAGLVERLLWWDNGLESERFAGISDFWEAAVLGTKAPPEVSGGDHLVQHSSAGANAPTGMLSRYSVWLPAASPQGATGALAQGIACSSAANLAQCGPITQQRGLLCSRCRRCFAWRSCLCSRCRLAR
jgi:hypothetical protein